MAAEPSCVQECGRHRAPGRIRCAECLLRRRSAGRRDYRDRVLRGQCVYCKTNATVGIFCFTHWLKNVGVPHGLGSKTGTALLQKLWDAQGGLCAVTGELLTPGANASLDHKRPKSRGGDNSEENLRWVLLRVNQSKWDMTDEEFVRMCRVVVRAHDQRVAAGTVRSEQTARSN